MDACDSGNPVKAMSILGKGWFPERNSLPRDGKPGGRHPLLNGWEVGCGVLGVI